MLERVESFPVLMATAVALFGSPDSPQSISMESRKRNG